MICLLLGPSSLFEENAGKGLLRGEGRKKPSSSQILSTSKKGRTPAPRQLAFKRKGQERRGRILYSLIRIDEVGAFHEEKSLWEGFNLTTDLLKRRLHCPSAEGRV